MIMKRDKGQGILLVNINDYYNSLEPLFSDKMKFQVANDDPTLRNLYTFKITLVFYSLE